MAGKELRRLYHVGTRDTCSMQNLVFAGVSFPRSTEKRVGEGEDAVALRRSGAYAALTDTQAKAVAAAIDAHVQRTERDAKGRIIGGGVYPHAAPYYDARDDDEPVRKHVYMTEATADEERASWGASQPPLVEEAEPVPARGREPDVFEQTPAAARATAKVR